LSTNPFPLKLIDADREFNDVIQEFCDGFESPKMRNLADIIEYNKEHAEIAMPPRRHH
jgi:amidase